MAILYCGCGYRIWSELWWRESGHVLLFFDDQETSETYGEQMTRCPECRRPLRGGVLRPADAERIREAQKSREAV